MNLAIIELGSNINPIENKEKAILLISEKFKILALSDFIWTKPVTQQNNLDKFTPDYLNGAFAIETDMDIDSLKIELKNIEKKVGRIERNKFDDREIDLDIIFWNDSIIHKDYFERDFVKKTVDQVLLKLMK